MELEDGQSLLIRRLITLLSRVGEFWLNRSYVQQIILVLVLLLAKNAFDVELRNIQEAYLPGAQEFPRAVGYFSASFGQVIIAYGLGASTTSQWVVLHAILIAIALGAAFYLISKAEPEHRSFMILVLASATATSSLFISIGKYDVVTFFGAVILALARTFPAALAGAFIMASGNPEQAIVATGALLLLSRAPEFYFLRARAITCLVLSLVAWIVVQVWFAVSSMSVGRIQLLPDYLAESLARVSSNPGNVIWSWLNAGWILVLLVLLLVAKGSRIWAFAALVAIPALATVITADGGRVFGSIVLPTYLVAGLWFGRRVFRDIRHQTVLMGAAVSLLVILPITIRGPGWLFAQVFGLFGRLL